MEGATSVTIGLGKQPEESSQYTVRLHFSEPDQLAAGKRVFAVSLQGKSVLEQLDVSQEAGGANRAIVREFRMLKRLTRFAST